MVVGEQIRPRLSAGETLSLLDQLRVASELAGVHFHASDENGALPKKQNHRLRIQTIPSPQFFYRVDPAGRIHTGRAIYQRWDPERIPRWNPRTDNAVDTVRYWATLESLGNEPS